MDIEKLQVRGLTRGEIKGLKAQGIELGKLTEIKEDERDDALDKLFKLACPQIDPNDLTPGEALDLYTKIVAECYMRSADRKNSKSPQSSASEKDSMTAASAKRRGSKGKGTARR